MNPWMFLAGAVSAAVAVVGIFMAGMKAGRAFEENTTIKADLKNTNLVRVRQETLIKEVPRIVTKTVTREVEVVKEVERVVTVAHSMLSRDCVLPDNFGMLLVAAASGVDPESPGAAHELAGKYDCNETLEAVLSDLRSGWRNTARLEGLQSWAKLVTKGDQKP